MGAELGQGWLFGGPAPLSSPLPVTGRGLRFSPTSDAEDDGSTPFELVSARRTPRRSSKRLLLKISRLLEQQALAEGEATVVLTTLQDARRFTPAMAERYERLARATALVGVSGTGLGSTPIAGVRGAMIDHDERLAEEWNSSCSDPTSRRRSWCATTATMDLTSTVASTTRSPTTASWSCDSPPI